MGHWQGHGGGAGSPAAASPRNRGPVTSIRVWTSSSLACGVPGTRLAAAHWQWTVTVAVTVTVRLGEPDRRTGGPGPRARAAARAAGLGLPAYQ